MNGPSFRHRAGGRDTAGVGQASGRVVDPDSAEAPGKILHELRRTTYADVAQGLELPPVHYGTVDATPLRICLLRDAWKWGLSDREVEASLPNLQAAARWLTEFAPDEDGLLPLLGRRSRRGVHRPCGGRTRQDCRWAGLQHGPCSGHRNTQRWMTVRGLRFAGQSFAVRCTADGSTEVLDAPDGIDIVIV